MPLQANLIEASFQLSSKPKTNERLLVFFAGREALNFKGKAAGGWRLRSGAAVSS